LDNGQKVSLLSCHSLSTPNNNNSYKYDNNEIKVIIIIKPTFKFSFKFFSFVGIMFTKGKIVIRMVWRMLFLLVVNLAEFLVLGPF